MALYNYSDSEKEELLISVEKLIWSIIYGFNNIQHCDKEDIHQSTMMYLWKTAIPKFDKTRGVPFKDYAYVCIRNFVTRGINRLNRHNKRNLLGEDALHVGFNEDHEEYTEEFLETITDLKISELKKYVYEEEGPLKAKEKEVIKMIFDNPKITQREISEKLGFSHASGVSAILGRMRRRLKKEKRFKF